MWEKFCVALDHPEWLENPQWKTSAGRSRDRERLHRLIADIVRQKSSAHWLDLFAKVGIPAYYPRSGTLFIGQPADFGEKLIQDYLSNRYHKVGDEVQPNWTFEGAAQDTEFLLKVGLEIANSRAWPQWREGNEFKARRDAMMKESVR